MRRLSGTLSLALALLMLTGIMPSLAEGISITDMIGRRLTLAAPAERVVVLMPGDLEIVYALGAGGKAVGRGEYCNCPRYSQAGKPTLSRSLRSGPSSSSCPRWRRRPSR